ncbi:MAG: hypothetical protein Ta2B_14100 [Termitinemataceae bacterium]|nr:MAG: hypothetical protein Ta2B_14100 [Termitinemataceae bacterium]
MTGSKKNSKKKSGKKESAAAAVISTAIILLGFAFFVTTSNFIHGRNSGTTKTVTTKPKKAKNVIAKAESENTSSKKKSKNKTSNTQTKTSKNKTPTTQPIYPPIPVPEQKGTIVFMLDDAGNNLPELEPFLRFPGPLTIAVLPALPNSVEAARRIRSRGKTVFLHQPMESLSGQDPGPGAIYTGMSREEVLYVLAKNVNEVGPVAGINNHQGSKATQDKMIMDAVLDFCKENNLVFLDSRTTASTVVPLLAAEKGIKILQRSIFLDNEPHPEMMQDQIDAGLKLLSKQDTVVMIGHTWSKNLAPVLLRNYEKLSNDGWTFSTSKDINK